MAYLRWSEKSRYYIYCTMAISEPYGRHQLLCVVMWHIPENRPNGYEEDEMFQTSFSYRELKKDIESCIDKLDCQDDKERAQVRDAFQKFLENNKNN